MSLSTRRVVDNIALLQMLVAMLSFSLDGCGANVSSVTNGVGQLMLTQIQSAPKF